MLARVVAAAVGGRDVAAFEQDLRVQDARFDVADGGGRVRDGVGRSVVERAALAVGRRESSPVRDRRLPVVGVLRGRDGGLVMCDGGVGIPDEEKSAILEKGYQRPGSTGSGLGMYLVRRILDAYGGDIAVLDAESGGARFDVTLRRA